MARFKEDFEDHVFHWHYVLDKDGKVIAKYGFECYARELIREYPLRKYTYQIGEPRKI